MFAPVNSPPVEGWQAQPDGVVCIMFAPVNSPPVEGWQAQPDGVVCIMFAPVNSPPVEGWQAQPDGVVAKDLHKLNQWLYSTSTAYGILFQKGHV